MGSSNSTSREGHLGSKRRRKRKRSKPLQLNQKQPPKKLHLKQLVLALQQQVGTGAISYGLQQSACMHSDTTLQQVCSKLPVVTKHLYACTPCCICCCHSSSLCHAHAAGGKLDPTAVSVQSGKTYEQEFAPEIERAQVHETLCLAFA